MESTTLDCVTARQRFKELLDLVEAGQEIIITRHGQELAKLVPATYSMRKAVKKALHSWREARRGVRLHGDGSDLSLRELIDTGRR